MLNFHLCRIRVNSSPYVILRHPGIPLANEMSESLRKDVFLRGCSRVSRESQTIVLGIEQ